MFNSLRFDRQFLNRLGGMCFIDAGVDTGGGGGAGAGGGGTPAAVVNSGGASAAGGAPSAQSGAQGGSPSSGQGDGKGASVLNWADAPAQFRQAFDELKSKYEPWGKLADTYKVDHDVVGTQVQSFQGLINEAYDLGEKTGYTAEQIERSLQKNLVGTLHFLRSASAKAGGAGGQQGARGGQGEGADNLESKMQKAIQDAVKPYQDDLTKRQADNANQLFDKTCNDLMGKAYGEAEMATMPPAFKNLLLDAASELMKYDEDTGKALLQGKTAGLQKHFNDAKTIIEGAFIEWQKWQTGKASGGQQRDAGAGGQGGGQGGQGKGAPGYKGNFLDDLAQGDDNAFAELRLRRGAS